MFESLKKSKTLRSILGAAAFFVAGTPAVANATPAAPQKIVESSTKTDTATLIQNYLPLCAQLEGNLPYCYKDKGVLTAGAGVHLKDFSELGKLEGIKLTLKKGTAFKLTNHAYLRQLADADWNSPTVKIAFPEVISSKKVKLADCVSLNGCKDSFPKGSDKIWNSEQLIVIPSAALKKINETAIDFCAQKAVEIHPNLFELPPSCQLVVLDLIYNLGYVGYRNTYPKFQTAVKGKNLLEMRNECGSKNKRRSAVREGLITGALLFENNPKITSKKLLEKMGDFVVTQDSKLAPILEKDLWKVLGGVVGQNFKWYQMHPVMQKPLLAQKSF